MDHRKDCQLLTVPTYGLCTCDFDDRARRSLKLGIAEARKVITEEKYPLDPRIAAARKQ